jgi:hypothetical protein
MGAFAAGLFDPTPDPLERTKSPGEASRPEAMLDEHPVSYVRSQARGAEGHAALFPVELGQVTTKLGKGDMEGARDGALPKKLGRISEVDEDIFFGVEVEQLVPKDLFHVAFEYVGSSIPRYIDGVLRRRIGRGIERQ